jgi:inner membrane protein
MAINIPGSVLPSAPPKSFFKRFLTVFKMLSIAVLILLLLIPLSMVQSTLQERLQRHDTVVREINATWGSEQAVIGPVLIVPFKDVTMNMAGGSGSMVRRAYFLPATFKANGKLKPDDRLHRGIYKTVVYSGTLDLSGSFARPSFEEWKVDQQNILWDEAEVAISITDLRGAREMLRIKLGEQMIPLKPGKRLEGFEGGAYARIKGLNAMGDTIPFELSVTINGSRSLRFAPIGVNNEVTLASTWPDPSFQGAFPPSERKVESSGFSARWQVSNYGRSYPQQWIESHAAGVAASLFGVDLVPALDSYRYVERAIKYGVLVITLLFIVFFLFEVLSSVRIHPFQYALVGIALCLFYLGLLALSEVISFNAAYWIGAAASSLMIALYSAKVLHSAGRACLVAAGLIVVYAFLFVILCLQDYSLLVGTAGLFLVLAILMYVTRNIDWYARDSNG